MRILTLIHEFPPIGGGGGAAAQDICSGLAARGHDVQVLTVHWSDLTAQETQNQVVVHRLKSGRRQPYRAGFIGMSLYVLAAFWRGLGIIRRWKPDLLHAHFAVPAGALAWLLSRLTGTPYVITAHLGDVPGGVPEKTNRWFRWIFPLTPLFWRGAAKIIAVSSFTRQLALKNYHVSIDVIPNGVNLDDYDPGDITTNNPPRIIFVGRFMAQKDPVRLVNILHNLKDVPWTCTMVGDGPLRPDVEKAISDHSLSDRITLTGWVKPREVLEQFRQSDILFMPSHSEGLPVVGVQAMAMGLALVLSDVGGCGDLIKNDVNGYLVDKDDIKGFENALRSLINDHEKLLSFRQSSRHLASQFDINHIVAAYHEVFCEVFENHQSSQT